MIADLRKYLEDSNAASHESFEKLNKELSQHGFESSLQRLGKSVGEYNMEESLKILAELEDDYNNLWEDGLISVLCLDNYDLASKGQASSDVIKPALRDKPGQKMVPFLVQIGFITYLYITDWDLESGYWI